MDDKSTAYSLTVWTHRWQWRVKSNTIILFPVFKGKRFMSEKHARLKNGFQTNTSFLQKCQGEHVNFPSRPGMDRKAVKMQCFWNWVTARRRSGEPLRLKQQHGYSNLEHVNETLSFEWRSETFFFSLPLYTNPKSSSPEIKMWTNCTRCFMSSFFRAAQARCLVSLGFLSESITLLTRKPNTMNIW